jgi:tRNA1(Val) A37 N6-methylase TrmN6
VLLGAAIAPGHTRLLDLGSGVGTASLVALTHFSQLSAVLAERDPDALTLAQANITGNGFAGRAVMAAIDVTAKGQARIAAGLADNLFDAVIANPPFFDDAAGTLAQDGSRAGARHMDRAALDLWVKTSASCASAGAEIVFVYPAAQLAPLLAAFEQRFGAVTILPLTPRPDTAASRILFRAIKGSRAPLRLLASRSLHGPDGRGFAPDFDAIFRGEQLLVW